MKLAHIRRQSANRQDSHHVPLAKSGSVFPPKSGQEAVLAWMDHGRLLNNSDATRCALIKAADYDPVRTCRSLLGPL